MGWFGALRRLSGTARARLVAKLAGHPRAVEFANDLIDHALVRWQDTRGDWTTPERADEAALEREWSQLIEPALPQVRDKLWDDLLLAAIWDRVLDASQRRMLGRMALLRGSWDWDLVAVLGDAVQRPALVEATAQRLRQTSLLEQVEESAPIAKDEVGTLRKYTLHASTVQFITSRIRKHPAYRRAAHRRIGAHLEGASKESPYIETRLEAGHHLFEAGEFDRSYKLLGSASDWLQERGRVREGLHVLVPFLTSTVLAALSPPIPPALLGTLGRAYYRLGQLKTAFGYHQQSLVIAREIGNLRAVGDALGNLGLAAADLGQVKNAIIYYNEQLTVVRMVGDRRGEQAGLGNLGLAYAAMGQMQIAIDYHEKALQIAREIDDQRAAGSSLGNLGNAYWALGQVEKAIGYYEQALPILRGIGDRQGEGSALGNLGNAYSASGQVEKGIAVYEEQLAIVREIGYRRGEAAALANLGVAYARLRRMETAIGYFEEASAILRDVGERHAMGNVLANLGNAYADFGQVEKAIDYCEQALRIGEEIKDPQLVQFATANLQRLRAD